MDTIKEVYGLTVLYRHIYAVKGTILSHFKVMNISYKDSYNTFFIRAVMVKSLHTAAAEA